jgi:hypothetical protein
MARRVNLALLALLVLAFATGWVAFGVAGWTARLVLALHASAGLGLVLLVPWKSFIAQRGLRRRRPGRWLSVLLLGVLCASLVAGLLHAAGLPWWGPVLTAMDLHVGGAVLAVPLVIWHVLRRPVVVRAADLSRRALLRGGVLVGSAAGVYALGEVGLRLARLPGAGRALTGSYEVGSFRPDQMPVSSWTIDPVPVLDSGAWTVAIGRRALGLAELDAYSDQVRAVLDCTGGFWSEQDWSGARLSRLLSARELAGAASVRVVSATGYDRRFGLDEVPGLLLATRAGGVPLSPGHGFPTRLVVPGRRGFWWVKWVVRIEPDPMPAWWQSPFPIH